MTDEMSLISDPSPSFYLMARSWCPTLPSVCGIISEEAACHTTRSWPSCCALQVCFLWIWRTH